MSLRTSGKKNNKQIKEGRKRQKQADKQQLQYEYAYVTGGGAGAGGKVGRRKAEAAIREYNETTASRKKKLSHALGIGTLLLTCWWAYRVSSLELLDSAVRLVLVFLSVPFIVALSTPVSLANQRSYPRKGPNGQLQKVWFTEPIVQYPPTRVYTTLVVAHVTFFAASLIASDPAKLSKGLLEAVIYSSIPAIFCFVLVTFFLVLIPTWLARSDVLGFTALHQWGLYLLVPAALFIGTVAKDNMDAY